MPKAFNRAVTTCTVGEEAWTSLIGFHGIWRYQVPRGGTRYQWRWRSTKESGYFSRRETATVSGGGGSVPGGAFTGDFMLRLPLDSYWPNFHLAPYAFVGVGGVFIGSPWEREQ